MEPDRQVASPRIPARRVDFPEPTRPGTTVVEPWGIRRLRSCRTGFSCEAQPSVASWKVMAASGRGIGGWAYSSTEAARRPWSLGSTCALQYSWIRSKQPRHCHRAGRVCRRVYTGSVSKETRVSEVNAQDVAKVSPCMTRIRVGFHPPTRQSTSPSRFSPGFAKFYTRVTKSSSQSGVHATEIGDSYIVVYTTLCRRLVHG